MMEGECGGRKLGDEEVHGHMQRYLSSHTGVKAVEDEERGDRETHQGFKDRVHGGLRDLRDWAK